MAVVALSGAGLSNTNLLLLIQIGLVSSLPYLSQLAFETGIVNTFVVFVQQLLSGVIAFSIFRMQSEAARPRTRPGPSLLKHGRKAWQRWQQCALPPHNTTRLSEKDSGAWLSIFHHFHHHHCNNNNNNNNSNSTNKTSYNNQNKDNNSCRDNDNNINNDDITNSAKTTITTITQWTWLHPGPPNNASQTTAYYFSHDVLYGGAAYIHTGRGFAYRPSSFVQQYASYGRSHLHLGFELGLLAVVVAAAGGFGSAASYGALMWVAGTRGVGGWDTRCGRLGHAVWAAGTCGVGGWDMWCGTRRHVCVRKEDGWGTKSSSLPSFFLAPCVDGWCGGWEAAGGVGVGRRRVVRPPDWKLHKGSSSFLWMPFGLCTDLPCILQHLCGGPSAPKVLRLARRNTFGADGLSKDCCIGREG
eukprot:360560-Chlamydomonas_euryale.AAC.3